MGDWYPVVKTIKGKQYRYLQQTYRVGGRVFTRNWYLGRVDAGASSTPSGSPTKRPQAPSASVPLFQSPSDFGAAMLKQFDAPQWGKDAGEQLLGSAVSGATTAKRRGHNRRPSARFDFNKPVVYDPEAKRHFHSQARARLRKLAAALGLQSGDYDLRSNQGGSAVSGEVTLHTDHLYVQVNQSVLGDTGILFRHCQGRRDYTGGANNFAPLDLLNDTDELASRIRRAGILPPAQSPATTTKQNPTLSPRPGHIQNQSRPSLTTDELLQFTGTENVYRHSLVPDIRLTDGAKYVAETAGAQWLMDEIALAQRGQPAVSAQEFQVWKLTVSPSQSAVLTCGDGNGNTVFRKTIAYTDFPAFGIELWCENKTILLPSER